VLDDDVPNHRPLRIFLSSTARDLPEHRKAVAGVIDRLGHAPMRMETFGAREDQSLAECKRLAAEADAMVVVVAHRYGWVPTPAEGGDGEKSITWHEVEAAVLAARPVFRYLYDDAASPGQRDDDERLERFRQFLRRYPCDTFSTPDDLATRVAVALGDWSRRRARDFAPALQMIDLAGFKPQPETLRASTFFKISLIRLALEDSALSLAELDRVIEGSRTRAAILALVQHVQRCAAELSDLRRELSSAKDREREISAQVQELVTERPPAPPDPPRPPSQPSPLNFDYDRNSPANRQVQLMQYETYLKQLEEHRHAEERHKAALLRYAERQATIPEHRRWLATAQQHVSQLEFNLSELANECASEQRRLQSEVGQARDQDVADLLAAMRDRGAQQLADPSTFSQGFLLLLATALSRSFLTRCLALHAAAALRVDQVGDDAAEEAERAVRRGHQRIGRDCLALFGPLQEGLAQGRERTDLLRRDLDALSPDERFFPAAQDLLAFVVPTIEAYDKLVDPASIASAATAIDRQRTEVGQAIGAAHSLLDQSAAFRASAEEAEKRAAYLLERMRESAAEYEPWLDDCKISWTIVSLVRQGQGLGDDTVEFCGCLQAEAERRLGEPVERFVEGCDTSGFGVPDAEAVRAQHIVTRFLDTSEALKKRFAELEARAAELARASEDIADLPRRQVEAYRKRLKLLSLLAVLPIFNVLCALLAGTLVQRYAPALRSHHPEYLDLVRWSVPRLLWTAGASALGVLAGGFALYWLPQVDPMALIVLTLIYLVGLVLWISRAVRVLRMKKQM
jgi:uncharacterized protein DUF4062